ncbi:ABC transporter ATP-binding protein [Methanocella sp. CWC-04]|uniref:ABC transporter ATP-binding protein n=1 Tax=Methanooceanicella nereidis TaxID=2052831 RepID=A0AAP2REP7_9EURY|nr:ABC transporter ATP-binding protein [Methanocella sp. CWC-04]
MISFKNFTYTYPKGTEPALKNIDLDIEEGEFILVTGSSGAGKTTLCRALFGALHHDIGGDIKGSIQIKGKDVSQYNIGIIGAFMGVVFDDPDSQLFMPLVEDEIKFGLQARNLPSSEKDVIRVLDRVGIAHLIKRAPHELSGGQKQKVAIAAAMANDPEILVFDEPTSQLDPQSTIEIFKILSELRGQGKTIILVEQKLEDIIDKVDKIAVIDHGNLAAFGKPRESLKCEDLYRIMSYPCVSKLSVELRSKEMMLSLDEGKEFLKANNYKLKPSNGRAFVRDDRNTPILSVNDLKFGYNGVDVLKGISFDVMPGEVFAILGHNGCGKTTLLKNIIGLLKPSGKGMVLLDRTDVKDINVEDAAKTVGFLFQNPDNMLFAETVLEEVMFGPDNLGLQNSKERSMKAIEEVGLIDRINEYPRYLSNGEKLRLCIASILAMGPRLIILDEPTTGLDDNECGKLMEVVLKLKSEGVAIIMVTHDMNLVARYTEKVIVLSDGRIFKEGSPSDVLKDNDAMKAASLKSPPIIELSKECGCVYLTVEDFLEAII